MPKSLPCERIHVKAVMQSSKAAVALALRV